MCVVVFLIAAQCACILTIFRPISPEMTVRLNLQNLDSTF